MTTSFRNSDFSEMLVPALERMGINCNHLTAERIPAGVSSDVWLIRTRDRILIAKRPLPQLRTVAVWHAPIERGRYEYRWLKHVSEMLPDSVANPIGYDEEASILAMEFLSPDTHTLWKERMFDGIKDAGIGKALGNMLGVIHEKFCQSKNAQLQFAAKDILYATRISPYFLATAQKHPAVADVILGYGAWLWQSQMGIIHGDVSPKNIMIGPRGPVILDAECACVSHPSFDVAFLLSHLCLKLARFPALSSYIAETISDILDGYSRKNSCASDIMQYSFKLLPVFILARIDGKVPVEYINDVSLQDRVRYSAINELSSPTGRDFIITWLNRFSS